MVKKKARKTKDKKEKPSLVKGAEGEAHEVNENPQEYGGMNLSNFKKNLGCG